MIGVDMLGHGSMATANHESAIKLAAVDPDDTGRTVLVSTATVDNVRDGKISYETFVGYFGGLLARSRTVEFKLWHCFVGSATTGQLTAVKRVADAFRAAGSFNVEVMGYTGRALFEGSGGRCGSPGRLRGYDTDTSFLYAIQHCQDRVMDERARRWRESPSINSKYDSFEFLDRLRIAGRTAVPELAFALESSDRGHRSMASSALGVMLMWGWTEAWAFCMTRLERVPPAEEAGHLLKALAYAYISYKQHEHFNPNSTAM